MRLLVVEDDPAMASLLQRAMRKEGYAVAEAATGTDALWQALEHDFDAVVLDAMIPAPDGFEVVPPDAGRRPLGAGAHAHRPRRSATGSAGSTSAPTTTWSSRSRWPSCTPGCGH